MPILRIPETLILKTLAFRNSSLIVSFLSKEYGVVSLMAKGHRRHMRKGFEGGLDVGCGGEMCYIPSSSGSLGIMTEWMERRRPLRIGESYEKFLMLSAACDMTAMAGQPDMPAGAMFDALNDLIRRIDVLPPDAEKLTPVFFGFILTFLETAGYGLSLDRCVVTGEPLSPADKIVFVPRLGGAVKVEALDESLKNEALSVTIDALAALRFLDRARTAVAFGRLNLNVRQRNAIARVLFTAVCDVLERRPVTLIPLYKTLWPNLKPPRGRMSV